MKIKIYIRFFSVILFYVSFSLFGNKFAQCRTGINNIINNITNIATYHDKNPSVPEKGLKIWPFSKILKIKSLFLDIFQKNPQ